MNRDSLQRQDVEVNRKTELVSKGNAICQRLMDIYADNVNYYLSLKGSKYFKYVDQEMNQAMYILQATANILKQTGQKDISDKAEKQFMNLAQRVGI
jgi:hypothetical protein